MKKALNFVLVFTLIFTFVGQAGAAIPERKDVDKKYQWNLTAIYKDQKAFNADKEAAAKNIKELAKYKGKLTNATTIKKVLDLKYSTRYKVQLLGQYANLSSDADTRDTAGLALKSVIDKLGTDFDQTVSYIEPELLKLSTTRLKYYASLKSMKDYDVMFKELIRSKNYVLSDKEEKILAGASAPLNAGYNIYDTYTAGEMKFGEVTLKNGEKVTVSPVIYTQYRQDADRDNRKAVFDSIFTTYKENQNTLALTLSSQIDANIFLAKTRNYPSALSAALFSSNIPAKAYENLIASVNKELPTLYNYLELKKNILGVNELHYYDLYAPITSTPSGTYTYEEAVKLVDQAFKSMGGDYEKVAAKAMAPGSGWIDAFPNQGKATGGYSSDIWRNVHPFILMNFSNDYDSVSTLAHEMGHTMHSYYSNNAQPFPKAWYSTFVAEIASTLNENLLFDQMLKNETDPQKKIELLGDSLESMRTTVYRQAMFAEFEYELYKAAESKKALTADFLNAKYLELMKKYYGDAKGVVKIDDAYATEWAYVPHFYYNFYVYNYVSGYLLGLTLADKIENDPKAANLYIEKVLKSGGSQYATDQLKAVGLDITNPNVYAKAFEIINKRIEELKKLTGK